MTRPQPWPTCDVCDTDADVGYSIVWEATDGSEDYRSSQGYRCKAHAPVITPDPRSVQARPDSHRSAVVKGGVDS